MAELSKSGLLSQNNQSFPNNNTGYITPDRLRNYNVDVIDSTVNQIAFDATLTSINSFTASASASLDELLALSASLSGGYVTQGELADVTGSLIASINTKLDSSWTSSVFQPFSTSVDSRLDNIESATTSLNAFTQSADGRLDNLETTTASINQSIVSLNNFTNSVAPTGTGSLLVTASYSGTSLTFTKGDASTFGITGVQNTASFNSYTASVSSNLSAIYQTTASLNTFSASQLTKDATLATYTGSNDTKWTTLGAYTGSVNITTASLNTFTSSANSRLNAIESVSGSWITESETGSFVKTGSNVFSGSQTITGSVYGNVIPLSIASSTASMDLSTSNFFTLTLVSGSAVRLSASNIKAGQTVSLLVSQPVVGFGNLTFDSTFKQTFGFSYVATQSGSANDILTFVTFNTASIWTANIKNLV